MVAIEKFRYVGITDECVECQQCGKADLKSTVVLGILDVDNNIEEYTYYGSTCAARALGMTGRGASNKVLGLARAAHLKLIQNAYDARCMLRIYGLPETGEPTSTALRDAVLQYWTNHRNAAWAPTKTNDDWRAMTLDMLARKQAALDEAAQLHADVPDDDKAMARFLATW